MFKTAATIFLISTCLVMQYAMQFAYLQCKFENSISTQPTCDCEKKYGTDTGNESKELPIQKNHFHLSIDVFLMPAENIMHGRFVDHFNKYMNKNISFQSTYTGSIFRPPQS